MKKKKQKKPQNNRFRKQKLHFKRKNKLSEIIQNFSTLIEYIIEYITMFYVIMWCKESLFRLFTSLIRDCPGHTICATKCILKDRVVTQGRLPNTERQFDASCAVRHDRLKHLGIIGRLFVKNYFGWQINHR